MIQTLSQISLHLEIDNASYPHHVFSIATRIIYSLSILTTKNFIIWWHRITTKTYISSGFISRRMTLSGRSHYSKHGACLNVFQIGGFVIIHIYVWCPIIALNISLQPRTDQSGNKFSSHISQAAGRRDYLELGDGHRTLEPEWGSDVTDHFTLLVLRACFCY